MRSTPPSARRAGYIVSGLAAFLVVFALLHHRESGGSVDRLFIATVKSLVSENSELVSKTKLLADGTTLEFLEIHNETGDLDGYAFHTEAIGGEAVGYGGRIVLAVILDTATGIRELRIIKSNETPSYLIPVVSWMKGIVGRRLGSKDPLADVDTVTGATITSSSVRQILDEAGRRFTGEILGMDVGGPRLPTGRGPGGRFFLVAALMLLAPAIRMKPHGRGRLFIMVFVAMVLGLHLNIQYSVAHIFSLLGLRVPPPAPAVPFLLVVILPVTVLLFGNFYCGYLCPFGALQELVGRLHRFVPGIGPDQKTARYGRLVKYLLLFVFVSLFALSLDTSLASNDPLVTVFGGSRTHFGIAVTILVLGLSIPYGRFWCRNLCPTGAFLSLLNGVHLLKRHIPAVNPGLCEFGVSNVQELDCLCCDRCRLPAASTPDSGSAGKKRNMIFIILILVLAGLLARETAVAWREGRAVLASGRMTGVAGRARDVDMGKLRRLIDGRMLSDHEAGYYKTVSEAGDVPR
jgi:Na+-translocating ferredoxin:NAD+ oxidoreductase RnfG subunit